MASMQRIASFMAQEDRQDKRQIYETRGRALNDPGDTSLDDKISQSPIIQCENLGHTYGEGQPVNISIGRKDL